MRYTPEFCRSIKTEGLSINSDIADIADHIIQHFYNRPMKPDEKPSLSQSRRLQFGKHYFHRIAHGGMHVSRAAMWVKLFARLYHELGQHLSEEDIKLLQIAALLHDAGREGEGKDEWDEDSAINTYLYLIHTLNVPKRKAVVAAEAIANKDHSRGEAVILLEMFDSNRFFMRAPGMKRNTMTKILHDADALDVIRARHTFHVDRLDYVQDMPAGDPVLRRQIVQIVGQARALIHAQGDRYRHLDLSKKAQFHNHEMGCYRRVWCDVLDTDNYPLLRTLIDKDYRRSHPPTRPTFNITPENFALKEGQLFDHSVIYPFDQLNGISAIDFLADKLAGGEGMPLVSCSSLNGEVYGPVGIIIHDISEEDCLWISHHDEATCHAKNLPSGDYLTVKTERLLEIINSLLSAKDLPSFALSDFEKVIHGKTTEEYRKIMGVIGYSTFHEFLKDVEYGHYGNYKQSGVWQHQTEIVLKHMREKHVFGYRFCLDARGSFKLKRQQIALAAMMLRQAYLDKRAERGLVGKTPLYRYYQSEHRLQRIDLDPVLMRETMQEAYTKLAEMRPVCFYNGMFSAYGSPFGMPFTKFFRKGGDIEKLFSPDELSSMFSVAKRHIAECFECVLNPVSFLFNRSSTESLFVFRWNNDSATQEEKAMMDNFKQRCIVLFEPTSPMYEEMLRNAEDALRLNLYHQEYIATILYRRFVNCLGVSKKKVQQLFNRAIKRLNLRSCDLNSLLEKVKAIEHDVNRKSWLHRRIRDVLASAIMHVDISKASVRKLTTILADLQHITHEGISYLAGSRILSLLADSVLEFSTLIMIMRSFSTSQYYLINEGRDVDRQGYFKMVFAKLDLEEQIKMNRRLFFDGVVEFKKLGYQFTEDQMNELHRMAEETAMVHPEYFKLGDDPDFDFFMHFGDVPSRAVCKKVIGSILSSMPTPDGQKSAYQRMLDEDTDESPHVEIDALYEQLTKKLKMKHKKQAHVEVSTTPFASSAATAEMACQADVGLDI